MNTPRIKPIDWLQAGVICVFLGALGVHLDGPGIMDYADSTAATQAREQAMAERRAQLAAARMCGSENAVAHWTSDTQLVCRTKHGRLPRTVKNAAAPATVVGAL